MKKNRIALEKETVELMIRLYCRKKEKNTVLCPCKKCTVHCYKPVMRERMRQTMRFAGPRMIFYSPWAAIRHLLNL